MVAQQNISHSYPLTDGTLFATSKLVDDAQSARRDPSHSEIDFVISQSGLEGGDPNRHGQTSGKEKRVRATLSWALENSPDEGGMLLGKLIAQIKACGGFRPNSPNYVGEEAVENARVAFRAEGFELASDGELRPILLNNLSGIAMTDALRSYVRRANRGSMDAALVTGTGKDLLEATAAHVLEEKYGNYSTTDNFPTLLGQAFVILGFTTDSSQAKGGQQRLEAAFYEVALAVNNLRNKQGTGHGRPFPSTVSDSEAKAAIQVMGVVAEKMLNALQAAP